MSHVSIDRQAPVRFVRLDTGKRNILTLESVDAMCEALAPDEGAPVVVLSGRLDGFSCGLDNATLAKGPAEREALLTRMGELLLAAVEGPTRIVAACEGHAVAAGAMLLLVADIRLGVPGGYKVGFTEPALGMPLPEMPALLARERLDRRRLHALTVLGQTVCAKEAAAVGFLDELVDPERLHARSLEHAHAAAALSERAYQGTIASVWGASLDRLHALVEEQARRSAAARSS